VIPCTDLQAAEFVMAGVTAEDLWAQKVKNHWFSKIRNSDSRQLESYLWDLAPKEARLCRRIITWQTRGWKMREAVLTNNIDLEKLERFVNSLKSKAEDFAGSSSYNDGYKMVSQDTGVLELVRLVIVLAVINQLRRQMAGLV
jgi:hypothetical protein